jgi:glycosyltransferase involved in cell wall biosynthesis
MTDRPLVSILIPVYNAESWLAGTLESALGQTWPKLEIIVVDDGSRDGSWAIAQRYAGPRLKALAQPNAGAAAARNHALKSAQGDFIQYLDADDQLSPDKIARQLEVLAKAPAGCLGICGTVYFADGTAPENGQRVDGWPAENTDDPVEWLIALYGGNRNGGGMVHPGAWLTPRAVAERAGPWDETPSPDDDGEYFSRVVLASRGLRHAPGVHSFYRQHTSGTNLSSARSRLLLQGAMHSLDRKAEQLLARSDNPRARHGLARCYVERALRAYPYAPAVSRHGLDRARQLDPAIRIPSLGGKSELIRRLFGWKIARRLSAWANAGKSRLPSPPGS